MAIRLTASLALAVFALAHLLTTTAAAYEVGHGVAYEPVHQTLTRLALACLQGSGSEPSNCIEDIAACLGTDPEPDAKRIEGCWRTKKRDSVARYDDFTVGEIIEASRWPDNPTRGTTSFGANMRVNCENMLEDAGGLKLPYAGLLCNGHFGRAQFWHSQASSRDETDCETRERVLAWARFNYQVAVGHIKAGEDYCSQFDARSPIKDAMAPDGFPYCKERRVWDWVPTWLAAPNPPWEVSTLYGLTCANPFSSKRCKEKLLGEEEERARSTRLHAVGALLHLIQDSYSQSHAVRKSCGRLSAPVARIECSRVLMFTNYADYDAKQNRVRRQNRHGDSDGWPTIGDSCLEPGDFDDPVTASAKLLKHVQQGHTFEQALVDLERVFGTSADFSPCRSSGAGACYESRP